jgi:hypothetical protein
VFWLGGIEREGVPMRWTAAVIAAVCWGHCVSGMTGYVHVHVWSGSRRGGKVDLEMFVVDGVAFARACEDVRSTRYHVIRDPRPLSTVAFF